MTLIPVMDLLLGQVVRAKQGDRQSYRPIDSALCKSSDPLVVARILCEHCASRRLYIADLDALMGREAQAGLLHRLLAAQPELEVWLDAGFADAPEAGALRKRLAPFGARVLPVFGSESLRSREALARCFATPEAAVLSLDRRNGQRLDAAGCWDATEAWPRRVIVMTLERVGSDAGPDLETVQRIRARAPGAMLIGAGGIRNPEDLARAADAGADAWLVASALHDMRLPRVAH